MKHQLGKLLSVLSLSVTMAASAGAFTLTSSDIRHGEFMSKAQEFTGFGCKGGDTSPALSWSEAPKGTKSFAITVHDPDAPTGSGWWHWQVINIAKNVSNLPAGAGDSQGDKMPMGSTQIANDYGVAGFGGACPPEGHGAHRYRFTVHALSVEQLDLPKDASGALTGYMINANTIETSTIEALYKR